MALDSNLNVLLVQLEGFGSSKCIDHPTLDGHTMHVKTRTTNSPFAGCWKQFFFNHAQVKFQTIQRYILQSEQKYGSVIVEFEVRFPLTVPSWYTELKCHTPLLVGYSANFSSNHISCTCGGGLQFLIFVLLCIIITCNVMYTCN